MYGVVSCQYLLSVPLQDALSSILVARDGFGDMAVSNAIGSNVFDINLGLGLPFLLRIAIDRGRAFVLLTAEQQVRIITDSLQDNVETVLSTCTLNLIICTRVHMYKGKG